MLVKEATETPRTLHSHIILLGYLAEVAKKTLLLKTPWTLVVCHREIKLELCWKLPF